MDPVENTWPQRLSIALRLDQVVESPSNPRRTWDQAKDDELAASIAQLGVLQPVLVRPLEEGFELVFGHRRAAAARKAGLDTIPAFVRELSDLEVLEAQIVENTQRADVHPLEEADAYKALHEKHGRSVDDIAAKVGKSKAYVYARLKLCALAASARKAFFDGRLNPSTALLVARIPDEKLQTDATKTIAREGWDGPMSFRQASEVVQREYMLRLNAAPFSTTDLELVPSAGACTTCPKRTGNQPELFEDVKSGDVCTDPTCYRSKIDAEWKKRTAAAKDSGAVVIEGKKAKELFPYSGDRLTEGKGFIDLDANCWQDRQNRTWRQLLKKAEVDVVLARDPNGGIHELVPEKEARAAAKLKAEREPARDSRGRDKAQARKDLVIAKTCERARGQVLEKLPKLLAKGVPFWRWFASAFISEIWHDTRKVAATARGLDLKKSRPEEALRAWIAKASEEDVQALMVECVLRRDERGSWKSDFGDQFKAACAFAGVDLAKTKRTVAAELAAKEKERSKKKPKATKARAKLPGKKRAIAKVPTCRACGCTDNDCSGCIEKTGEPCTWVEKDLCSACKAAGA